LYTGIFVIRPDGTDYFFNAFAPTNELVG
jgi:hypothetical protein